MKSPMLRLTRHHNNAEVIMSDIVLAMSDISKRQADVHRLLCELQKAFTAMGGAVADAEYYYKRYLDEKDSSDQSGKS